ncbi:hypothetical protein L484_021224 [Morus notabilis]|uniref:Uncharacterized protein n=1 Tax=Morus notabilis TaxID=981085 RepID=W9RT59_9ROSA|nr:hypothetical protein L484_021224 [Morus notabilis]
MVSEQSLPVTGTVRATNLATRAATATTPVTRTASMVNPSVQCASFGGSSSSSSVIRSGPISFNHPIASKLDNNNFLISKKS